MFAFAFGLLLGCDPVSALQTPLKSPFPNLLPNVIVRQIPEKIDLSACPAPDVTPPENLYLSHVYKKSDETRSTVDRKSHKKYRKQTHDIRIFEKQVSQLANAYKLSEDPFSPQAGCVLNQLYDWATAKAYLGDSNAQGDYIRQWGLASVASSYLQISSAPYLNGKKRQVVENWLSDIATMVVADYPNNSDLESHLNNHLYWAAWAVTITGVALNNHDFYEWGINKARYALLLQAQENGILPLELARGKKALQYHIFAVSPLVMVAETAMVNGEDLYTLRDGILMTLVDRVIDALSDTAFFEKQAKTPQLPADGMSTGHLAWLEPYALRFKDKRIADYLQKNRPLIFRRLGGNLTSLYTAKAKNTAR